MASESNSICTSHFASTERGPAVITDTDVDLVAGRLKAWSAALAGLADPDACRQLLTILDEADGAALHKLMDGWRLPGEPVASKSSTPSPARAHGRLRGRGDVRVCQQAAAADPSTTSGIGYQLPDGTMLWLTESEWWQMMDHAVNDEVWRNRTIRSLSPLGSCSARSSWSPRSTLRLRQALHDLPADVGSPRSALTIRSAAARCCRVRVRRGASPLRSRPVAFRCK